LGLALAVCAVATGVLFLVQPLIFLETVWQATIKIDNLSVLAMVVLILVLSTGMKESGALDDLVQSVRRIFVDNRFTIGALPAMIGLLPMPGGALFSAPMIENLADEAEVSPEGRTFLNYWFRHVWEYSWPLYPGLILESAVIGVGLIGVTSFQFPLCMAAILGGSVFGLMGVARHFRKPLHGPELREQLGTLVRGFWPVLLITVLYIAILVSKIHLNMPFLIVLLVTVLLFGLVRVGASRFPGLIWRATDFKLLGTVYSVLVFKDIIVVSGAVDQLSAVFRGWGVPPIALFIAIPMLIGYLTGLTHSYVSVAFPLLLPFFGDPIDLSRVQLAYASGLIGVLLSPVHLCLILTTEYFGADINGVYKRLFLPVGVIALVALGIYFV
jgi:integral membrane protein (TIGR00529 family)